MSESVPTTPPPNGQQGPTLSEAVRELRELRDRMDRLLASLDPQATGTEAKKKGAAPPVSRTQPRLKTDLVDAAFVARRFGCSVWSVYRGRCGTGGIVPVSRSPWTAVYGQVEDEHEKFVERAVVKAATRRTSLVRRGGARRTGAA